MSVKDEPPYPPRQDDQHCNHDGDPHPAHSGSFFPGAPVSPYVFGELHPVIVLHEVGATLAEACLETLQPWQLFKSQHAEIAANDSLAKYSTGKLGVVSCLQRQHMACRYLRNRADCVYRNLTPFAFLSQLVAESFHSLRISRSSAELAAPCQTSRFSAG